MQKLSWCAIGDSFTYLNDHLDETNFYVTKGYLTRIAEKLPELTLHNLGINGSTTRDWLTAPLLPAEVYTILLGTNDWHAHIPLGTEADFAAEKAGSILGNLAVLLSRIRALSPEAKILVCTPVERTDFVYYFDHFNNAVGSYAPENGVMLSEVCAAIVSVCEKGNVPVLNLHDLCGFTPANAVKFKRVQTRDGVCDLPYPSYCGLPFDPAKDPYPYPPECHSLTYDGLHPTDAGNEILASLIAEQLRSLLCAAR